jgi:tRNA(Ile)-lysidine synthase
MTGKMARKSTEQTTEKRVLRFIKEKRLVNAGQKLVVAVSGGADSVCVLDILARLRRELGVELHIAHFNHRLRGTAADADARYVTELASRMGIPATVTAGNVLAYREKLRLSPEEAAREVRYSFLADVADAVGAERIAVGHTIDDQAETILMHLIRGSGTRGLRGLLPVSRWQTAGKSVTVIRPLLEMSRAETSAYCEQNGLATCTDLSNASRIPLRNRIRHELLPRLRDYNPKITEALLRTARIAGDDLDYIDAEAVRLGESLAKKQKDAVIFDKEGFNVLHPSLKRHLLRTSIESLLGNVKDIEAAHIEEIMGLLGKPSGRKKMLPGGLTFTIEYDTYKLGADPAELSPYPVLHGETRLNVPGKTVIPGWDICAEVTDAAANIKSDDEFTACFDFNKAGNALSVRRRKPGDRFQPLGMGQTKKLNQFMIDARIPRAWRPRLPLVCSEEQIIWVVGQRIDERVKVTENTNRVLRLEFRRTQ